MSLYVIVLSLCAFVLEPISASSSSSNTVSYSSISYSFNPTSINPPPSSATASGSQSASATNSVSLSSVSFDFDPTSTGPSASGTIGVAEVTGVSDNVTTFARLWGWHNCVGGQKSFILQGLEEAHEILGSKRIFWKNLDDRFNDYAAVEFMGDPRRVYKNQQKIKGKSL